MLGLGSQRKFRFDEAVSLEYRGEIESAGRLASRFGIVITLNSIYVLTLVLFLFQGFNINHNATRLAAMNKPVFNAIVRHSPTKPVIVFVPNRKTSQLQAIELMTLSMIMQESKNMSFLHCAPKDLQSYFDEIKDQALKNTLTYGIG